MTVSGNRQRRRSLSRKRGLVSALVSWSADLFFSFLMLVLLGFRPPIEISEIMQEVITAKDLAPHVDVRLMASVYFKNSINRYWRHRRDSS